jgi:hypothetical protein
MKFTLKDGKRLEGFGYIARSAGLEDRHKRGSSHQARTRGVLKNLRSIC